jgi:hypothetical protein
MSRKKRQKQKQPENPQLEALLDSIDDPLAALGDAVSVPKTPSARSIGSVRSSILE